MNKIVGMMILVLVSAAGCMMKVSTVPLASYESRPALDPGTVQVFLAEGDVPRAYEKIALIYAEEVQGFFSIGKMIDSMKGRAAKIGANGLILGGVGGTISLDGGDDDAVEIDGNKRVRAVAIYVK